MLLIQMTDSIGNRTRTYKFIEPKRLMKVDDNPFPMTMIERSAALIKKYHKKREREERVDQESRFDPH
jgi:hypothetical protein